MRFLLLLPLLAASVFTSAIAQIIQELDPGDLAGTFLIEDTNQSNVEIQLLIQSGEGDHSGVEGLPHYLEHLVWLSVAEKYPLARASGSNAFTSQWVTGYQVTVPADRLNVGLDTLLAAFETPNLDPAFMDEEIGIIAQEYETRQDGSDVEAIYRTSRRWLYALNERPQGVARDVLGVPEDFEAFTVADAVALHARSHVRAKAILTVRGGISAGQLAPLLATRVGTGGTFQQIPRPPFVSPPLAYERFATEDDRGVGAQLAIRKLISIPGFEDTTHLQETLGLVRLILMSTRDESLLTPLYYDEFLVSDLNLNASLVDGGTAALILTAEPEPGIALDALEPRLIQVWQDIADRGISQDTIDRTRDLLLRERASQSRVDYAAGPLRQALFSREPWVPWETRNATLKTVTKADVDAVVRALAKGPDAVRTALIEVREKETAQ